MDCGIGHGHQLGRTRVRCLGLRCRPNNTEVVRIDFSTPGNPVVTSLPQTGLQGAPTVDADSLLLVAVGDGDGSSVRVFNANTWAVVASVTTGLNAVTSVAISGQLALAASWEDSLVATVPIDGSPSQSLAVDLGPGLTAELNGTMGVCGELFATRIVLIDLSGSAPILLGGPVNTQLQTVTTLGINPGTPVTPEPQIVVTPASLDFGTARVNTAAVRTVTLENSGTAPLSVVGLKTSISQYVASPSGTLAAIPPGNSVAVQVTFNPTAVQPYPATLTMRTNDPLHPIVAVPLSGRGSMDNGTFESDIAAIPAVVAAGTQGAAGVNATSDTGTGISGTQTSPTGNTITDAGVFGSSLASDGQGVYGQANNGTGAFGVWGQSSDGIGVYAESGSRIGLYAESGSGIDPGSSSGPAVYALCDTDGDGVLAQSFSGIAVHAVGGGASVGTSPPVTQAGIFADGGSGPGGVFQSENAAQLNLVPSSTPLQDSPLFENGQTGDLYLYSVVSGATRSGTSTYETILWLCISPAVPAQGATAIWAQVQLGDIAASG